MAKSRFKEKVPCGKKNYREFGYGRPYAKVVSLESLKGDQTFSLEVVNSAKYETVNSLDLMNGNIQSISVVDDGKGRD